MTRALIMAGGADEKWTTLGGEGRRHFQLVRGERVIDRIVRQLRERGVTDIGIICPPDDDRYDIEGTWRVAPDHDEWGHEALNAQAHWSDTDRTLQVYGDTIFADRAMDMITGYERRRWVMWGRFGSGVIKGGGGELFATSFWPEHREAWVRALEMAFDLKARGITKRAGSWEGYRIMGGARGRMVGRHKLYPNVFRNLNDGLTDDFDTPAQFEKLRALFEVDYRPKRARPKAEQPIPLRVVSQFDRGGETIRPRIARVRLRFPNTAKGCGWESFHAQR